MTLGQLSSKGRKLMSAIVICVAAVVLLGEAGGAAGRQVPFCRHWVKSVSNKVLVRFLIDRPTYRPREVAKFRIDNIGSVPVRLISEYFSLERLVKSGWEVSPASPHAFSKIRLGVLEPGEAGFCKAFSIPDDLPAGEYRFRKVVVIATSHKRKQLLARFHVGT